MKGVCCICRKSLGTGRPASTKVVASFTLSHFGLCPTCLGRTQADIARIYGPGGNVQNPGGGTGLALEKGAGA